VVLKSVEDKGDSHLPGKRLIGFVIDECYGMDHLLPQSRLHFEGNIDAATDYLVDVINTFLALCDELGIREDNPQLETYVLFALYGVFAGRREVIDFYPILEEHLRPDQFMILYGRFYRELTSLGREEVMEIFTMVHKGLPKTDTKFAELEFYLATKKLIEFDESYSNVTRFFFIVSSAHRWIQDAGGKSVEFLDVVDVAVELLIGGANLEGLDNLLYARFVEPSESGTIAEGVVKEIAHLMPETEWENND
jgi:hypothetical protein